MAYIVIEGPTGVGKTTLTYLLVKHFGCSMLLDAVEPQFLSEFYREPDRYGLHVELAFLASRYQQQKTILNYNMSSEHLISDYLFARNKLFAHLTLDSKERELFHQIYSALAERLVSPDLVIYLYASVETLMKRIANRDRLFERNIDRSYVEVQVAVFESFFDGYKEADVIKIETDHLDLVRRIKDQRKVINIIATALKRKEGQ